MGTAGVLTGPALTVRSPLLTCTAAGTSASSTVPHDWHSPPHRPAHLLVRQPHREQRNAVAVDFAMTATLASGSDTAAWATPADGQPRRQDGIS
jgi:hypothetical protein